MDDDIDRYVDIDRADLKYAYARIIGLADALYGAYNQNERQWSIEIQQELFAALASADLQGDTFWGWAVARKDAGSPRVTREIADKSNSTLLHRETFEGVVLKDGDTITSSITLKS